MAVIQPGFPSPQAENTFTWAPSFFGQWSLPGRVENLDWILIPLMLFILSSFTLLNLQWKAEKQTFKVFPETHIKSIDVGKHNVL